MKRTAFVIAVVVVACAIGACLGGQEKQTKDASDKLGNQSSEVPPATLAEHDWKKAAQGHGAVGPIPAEDLARMEKASAPGQSLGHGDGGK